MNKPYLADISGLMRLLLAFGLLAAVAARAIAHMLSRHARTGLNSQFLAIAAAGVVATVGLIAKPELGSAFVDFVYSAAGQVIPQLAPKPADTSQAKLP